MPIALLFPKFRKTKTVWLLNGKVMLESSLRQALEEGNGDITVSIEIPCEPGPKTKNYAH